MDTTSAANIEKDNERKTPLGDSRVEIDSGLSNIITASNLPKRMHLGKKQHGCTPAETEQNNDLCRFGKTRIISERSFGRKV